MPWSQTGNYIPVMRVRPRANGERLTRWYTKGSEAWKKGELHRHAKLREVDVIEMRGLYAEGELSIRDLAALYDISHQQVWRILRGENWTHVPMPEKAGSRWAGVPHHPPVPDGRARP